RRQDAPAAGTIANDSSACPVGLHRRPGSFAASGAPPATQLPRGVRPGRGSGAPERCLTSFRTATYARRELASPPGWAAEPRNRNKGERPDEECTCHGFGGIARGDARLRRGPGPGTAGHDELDVL